MGHGEFMLFAQNAGLRNLSKLDMVEVWFSARLMKLTTTKDLKAKEKNKDRKTKIEEQE